MCNVISCVLIDLIGCVLMIIELSCFVDCGVYDVFNSGYGMVGVYG